MTIRSAVRRAVGVYRRQLPGMLQYMLLTVIIHLIPVVPALCLLDAALYPVLLACPALFVLLVLPMRSNAAQALQQALHGGRVFTAGLVSFSRYGQKLLDGLKRMLLLMLWALPVLAVTGAAAWLYAQEGVSGQTDIFTLLRPIKQLGGGDLMRGMVYLLLMYAALWLPLAVGCAFHSGARHARALGQTKLLRGHRGGQLLAWLAAQCTLLPWLAAMCVPAVRYAGQVMYAIDHFEFSGLVPSGGMLLGVAAATAVLLLPLLPLRDLIIAAWPACIHDETEADA